VVTKLKVLSLFSGAGGLDLGLERAGMEVVALCEIEPKARAVLRRHWPDTRIYDDVREVTRERLEHDGIRRPDLVAGGSPCQDLSVAGKRRGLDGARSGLFWEQCRIADEWEADILWENVPGALSSNGGADFAAVLWGITGALVELPDGKKWAKAGVLVGPKRTAVWRVADAQRFGVPQRRRRVYVVGCSGAVARRLAPLLLEFAGGEGNRPAGREAGTRAARTAADGSDDAGGPRAGRPDGDDDGRGLYGTDRTGVTGAAYSTGTGWWNDADGRAGTLRAQGHPHEANILAADVRNGTVDDVTQTLLAHKNGWSVNDLPVVLQEPQAFVKAKRASSNTDDDTWRDEPVSPTLNAFDNGGDTRATVLMVQPTEPAAFTPTGFANYQEGVGTLRARDAKGDANIVVQGTVVNALLANMSGVHGPCVDDAQGNRLVVVQVGQSPTGETDTAGTLGGAGASGGFRFDLETCGAYVVVDEVAKTLTTGNQRLNPEHETFVVQTPETFAFQPADQMLGKGALRAVRTDVAPTIALGDHHSDRGLRIVQQAPVAFSVREDAKANNFHATETDTALCVNALRPSPQSHHAQLFIVQGEEQSDSGVIPLAFSAGNAAEAYGLGISENLAPPLRAAASGSNQVPTVLYQDSQYGVTEYDTAGTLRAGRIPEHQMVVTETSDDDVKTPALVRMREGAPGGGKGPLVSENLSLTLATGNDQVLFQPVAFTQNQREEVRDLGMIASALSAESGSHQQTYIAMPVPDGE
jgi:site-specific DNA-cytosine methylase